MEFTPSTPQSLPTLPQLLPTVPSMLPQLLLMLPQSSLMLLQLIMPQWLLLQLIMPQLQLTERLRFTPMRFLPIPTPMLLPMTTPSLTSMPRSSPMVPATLPDLTPLLFPMAESNTSSTLPTVMMDMSLMSLMREPLSTQRLQHQLITLKSKVPQRTPTNITHDQNRIHIYTSLHPQKRSVSCDFFVDVGMCKCEFCFGHELCWLVSKVPQ